MTTKMDKDKAATQADPGTPAPNVSPQRSLRARFGVIDQSDKIFDEVRRLVEHEDGLVDKRIGWMLAFNGFLFAAYGLVLNAQITLTKMQMGVVASTSDFGGFWDILDQVEVLRTALMIAGCLSSAAALVGVWAAMRAMVYVRNDYGKHLSKLGDDSQLAMPAFPSVGRAAFFGNGYGLAVPCMAAVPWIYVWSMEHAGFAPFGWELAGPGKWWLPLGVPIFALFISTISLRFLGLKHPEDPTERHKK